MKYYILDKNNNIIGATFKQWGALLEKDRVVQQETVNDFKVSTIFLGIDLNMFQGKLLLFETMVFNSKGEDIYCDRYSSWKEAEEGHLEAIEWVNNGCKDLKNE